MVSPTLQLDPYIYYWGDRKHSSIVNLQHLKTIIQFVIVKLFMHFLVPFCIKIIGTSKHLTSLSAWVPSLYVRITELRIWHIKTVRDIFIMAVELWHRYSNEAEIVYWAINDGFKFRNPFGLRGLYEIFQRFNPSTAKLFNLNFHPLEIVSRWRDPQLQVSGNYSDLIKWRSTLLKSCWLMSHFIFNIFNMWYLMC